MFAGLGQILAPRAVVVVYGPFKYCGCFTTESNAGFDQWLKTGARHQGIRDIEAVTELATRCGLYQPSMKLILLLRVFTAVLELLGSQ
jgi:hypothetical protein